VSNLRQFSNNASTTLAASITSGATSLSVTSGTGALFPAITGTQFFTATLQHISAGVVTAYEIILVTARSGDTFTAIERAQEGTAAAAWSAGDTVALLPTAAGMAGFAQADTLQAQAGNFALDVGTANAYSVVLSPALTEHIQGMPIWWLAGHTSTGASTFNDGVGVESLLTPEGENIAAGDIEAGGLYCSMWSGGSFMLVTQHIYNFSQISGQIAAGQVPVGAVTQFTPNILASAALTGVPTAPTAANGTASTQVATTAFVNPGTSKATNGYRTNPDGTIDQWGQIAYGGSGGLTITFPKPWPNTLFSLVTTPTIGGNSLGLSSYNSTQAIMSTNSLGGTAQTFYWRAIGN
jgi:hypothetical protein